MRPATVACAVAAVVTALAQGPVRAQSAPPQPAPTPAPTPAGETPEAPAPTSAAAAPQAPVPSKAQFGVKTELVLVDASITDGESRPVTDLSVADNDELAAASRAVARLQSFVDLAKVQISRRTRQLGQAGILVNFCQIGTAHRGVLIEQETRAIDAAIVVQPQ